ncbi:SmtA protein [Salmonella bongori]|nr:SmtA protein [Salmonella bongori]
MQDRNFDDIAEKFSRNIYGTTKGQLRQAILWQDLDRVLEGPAGENCRCLMLAAAKGKRRSKWPSAAIR